MLKRITCASVVLTAVLSSQVADARHATGAIRRTSPTQSAFLKSPTGGARSFMRGRTVAVTPFDRHATPVRSAIPAGRVVSSLWNRSLSYGSNMSDVLAETKVAQRIIASRGYAVPPTYAVDNGVENAATTGRGIFMLSGLRPYSALGTYFHEYTHYTAYDSRIGSVRNELMADYGAGWWMGSARVGQRYVQAYLDEIQDGAGGDHGRPEQRLAAASAGLRDGTAGKELPPYMRPVADYQLAAFSQLKRPRS